MWTRSCSKVFKSIKKEAIWQRWSDVNTWHEWVPNIESCRLEKPFASGNSFTLKPKGSPAVTVQLLNVKREQSFTGCTRFFGATMYDIHEMHQDPQGIRLTVTLKVTGPLGFLWRKLVAEKIEANLPALLKNLAGLAGATETQSAPNFKQNSQTDHKPKLHLLTPISPKEKSKKTKPKSKSKLTISTTAPKKTNALLRSIPHDSTTPNGKVDSSMFTATQPKLSTPAPKPIAKKSKAKKPKVKKVSLASKKAKTKSTKAKKASSASKVKATAKKATAKKATAKKATAKKATAKKSTTAKKASAKTKVKAKASTSRPKAKKAKASPKAKAASKSKA